MYPIPSHHLIQQYDTGTFEMLTDPGVAVLVICEVITGEGPVGLPAGADRVVVAANRARNLQEAAQPAVPGVAARPAG